MDIRSRRAEDREKPTEQETQIKIIIIKASLVAELIIIITMIILVIIHCPNGTRTAGADRADQSAVLPGAVDDAYTQPRL